MWSFSEAAAISLGAFVALSHSTPASGATPAEATTRPVAAGARIAKQEDKEVTAASQPTARKKVDTRRQPKDPLQVIAICDELIMQHKAKEAIERFMRPDMIEHDPTVRGGSRQGLFQYMVDEGWDENRNPNSELVDIVDRRFASGELVVTMHHMFRNKQDRGTMYIDVFRVVDGLIVEHWDLFQVVPEKTNGNPHAMW